MGWMHVKRGVRLRGYHECEDSVIATGETLGLISSSELFASDELEEGGRWKVWETAGIYM